MKIKHAIYRAASILSDPNPENFNWKDAVLDALIMSGLSFFTTLAGIGTAGLLQDPVKGLVAALISAGCSFFSVLAMKRGLKPR